MKAVSNKTRWIRERQRHHKEEKKGRTEYVLRDLVDADAPHSADSQGTDERVRVVAILHKGVHSQQRQVRVALGVVDQVEIHQLFQLQILGLDAVHDVCEEGGDVFANRHVGDDLLHGISLSVATLMPQFLTEFVILALTAVSITKEAGVIALGFGPIGLK
jgi:hypothetical protein